MWTQHAVGKVWGWGHEKLEPGVRIIHERERAEQQLEDGGDLELLWVGTTVPDQGLGSFGEAERRQQDRAMNH